MFTGIITHQGLFGGWRRGRRELLVEAPELAVKLRPGGSLAVDGVCLSLVDAEKDSLRFALSQETLARTTLGAVRPRQRLNLELPLTLAAPLGGHLVTGHVDAVGKVLRTAERRPGRRLTVSYPPGLGPFLVPKGSVAVNGVSLTVAALTASSMDIELIPLTMEGTNLGALRAGAAVNIECDIIGKYVYNWLVNERRTG
ncbi:MAG TPA: riboflavin synthase [Burkholderiales bacterium]|nr:riboflavin synthase [Burkholderiales bacterium]